MTDIEEKSIVNWLNNEGFDVVGQESGPRGYCLQLFYDDDKEPTARFEQSCREACLRAAQTWFIFNWPEKKSQRTRQTNLPRSSVRISKIEYAMRIAEAAACRSEDPFYQVGASAMSEDGRIVATGYNGLPPGVQASPTWWNDKEKRKPFVLHAETNLCSMFKRGEVQAVCVTLMPCPDCMRVLAAHGVKKVYFRKHHEASHDSVGLAQFWGIKMQWLDAANQASEE